MLYFYISKGLRRQNIKEHEGKMVIKYMDKYILLLI